MADRLGAGTVMTAGSVASTAALVACALAPERWSFAAALIAMELAATCVLYATAFVAVVQLSVAGGQRSITHLTLIGGFASTLFWPLTTLLHQQLDWREVLLVFAAFNLLICMPIHGWIARTTRRRRFAAEVRTDAPAPPSVEATVPRRRLVFALMFAGFAIEGFVLSAVLLHMVPLIGALGLGTAGVLVSTLFGPAQVASRVINMALGGGMRQTVLAVIAAALLPVGLGVALGFAPAVAGVALFVILYGMGSGLMSIIGGSLPLEVFGRAGYGANVGMMSAARQVSTSFAPFVFAAMMAGLGVPVSLAALAVLGALGVAVFAAVAWIMRRRIA
jgi:hypothetical protein